MDHDSLSLPAFDPGSVWLCGAGPGDPGLLTLLAAHALRLADVIVHDALIDPRTLALARPGATLEEMGKRGGRASPTQSVITARLIELAGRGLRVLRLKGGDPFVFGRGADEALALAAAGIPFRIVPGISAGIGGLAYAGLPVTAGGVNSAVTLVTGHGPRGTLPDDLDWAALAGAPVLVIFMGLARLAELRDRLLAAGRGCDEPVAVVAEATTPRQRVVDTTLAALPEAVAAAGLTPPALLVIGPVVGLRARLDWWRPGEDG
jgi:uroporphyrin-III C-methyltransferase